MYLSRLGHSLKTKGHIGFSPKKKNSIISNIFGAAAYNGALSVLQQVFPALSDEINIEFKTEEKRVLTSAGGTLQRETAGSTPLMLAVLAGDQNLPTTRWLLEVAKCRTKVTDWQGNTLLHAAVRSNSPETLQYLLDTRLFEPFERNDEGETAVSLAQTLNLPAVYAIISRCKDNSTQKVLPAEHRSWKSS